MKQIYQISKVNLQVTFTRYNVNEDGSVDLKHTQALSFPKLLSMEQLVEDAKTRIEPGQDIEVEVSKTLNE